MPINRLFGRWTMTFPHPRPDGDSDSEWSFASDQSAVEPPTPFVALPPSLQAAGAASLLAYAQWTARRELRQRQLRRLRPFDN